jgi:tight adherence protein C
VTLLLILGLVLLAWSVSFVLRALAAPHGAGETIEQIGQYGFSSAEIAEEDDHQRERGLDRVASSFGELLGKRLSWFNEEELRIRLVAAGMYSTTPTRLLGYQGFLALGFLLLWVWVGGVQHYSPLTIVVGGAIALALGWLLPALYVTMQLRNRREAIDYELPEMIDLLIVSIEAGVSLPAAIRIASREIPGPLGQELRLTLQEQNLGLSTEDALDNLGVRADTPNMRMFVRSIIQGETLGISIGQIMRNLADEMRKRRKAKAEERARKAPVKMIFPLVLLIFPAMFVVLVLPAIITILDVLGT